jgi:hemerythrin
MYLNWDSTFATGINSIDEQHKELFERLDQLITAMKEGKGKNEINKTLDFLEEYVIKHFTEEEEIQKKNNYPKLREQQRQHEEFKKQLKELRKVFDTTGESVLLALNIQGKMITWCKNHIMNLDKDLGKFLLEKSKGI